MVENAITIRPGDLDTPKAEESGGSDDVEDIIGTIERILDKATGLIDRVASARNLDVGQGSQAPQIQAAGSAMGLDSLKNALEMVKSTKGDIPISELQVLMNENKEAIEAVLK